MWEQPYERIMFILNDRVMIEEEEEKKQKEE
jgi:hypothetical protein